MKKKLLSIFLSILMVFQLVPYQVVAHGVAENEPAPCIPANPLFPSEIVCRSNDSVEVNFLSSHEEDKKEEIIEVQVGNTFFDSSEQGEDVAHDEITSDFDEENNEDDDYYEERDDGGVGEDWEENDDGNDDWEEDPDLPESFPDDSTDTFEPTLIFQQLPQKLSYFYGEELDVEGAILVYTDTSGESYEIDLYDCNISDFDPYLIGTQEISVQYSSLIATYSVTVQEDVVKSISIASPIAPDGYYVGYNLPLNDAEIWVRYASGNKTLVPITSEMVSGFDPTCSFSQTVTVSYSGFSLSVEIEEAFVSDIEIVSLPSNTTVIMGGELDLSGGIFRINYENGYYYDVPFSDEFVFGFDSSIPGEQEVFLYYGDYSGSFFVNVVKSTLIGLRLESLPYKTEYTIFDVLDLTGCRVYAVYDNGAEVLISVNGTMVSGFDSSTAGVRNLTINYQGFTASFVVTVRNLLKGDLDANGLVDIDDARYLLLHLYLPDSYGLNQSGDFNGDGVVTDRDVFRLLQGNLGGFDPEGGADGGITVKPPSIGGDSDEEETVLPDPKSLIFEVSDVNFAKDSFSKVFVTLPESCNYTSAMISITVGNELSVVSPSWCISGDVLASSDTQRAGVLANNVQSTMSSGVIYAFDLKGVYVKESSDVAVSLMLCGTDGQILGYYSSTFTLSVTQKQITHCDLNCDGVANLEDALLLYRYLSGFDCIVARPEAMDVNSDGTVNFDDANALLQYIDTLSVS